MAPPLVGGLASRADSDIGSEPGRGLRLEEALPGSIAGVLTSLVAMSFVFHFLGGSGNKIMRLQKLWLRRYTVQRYRQVSRWRNLSYIDWLILALFVDSWLFYASSTVLQFGGFDMNVDSRACAAGSYICVVGYFISKGTNRLKAIVCPRRASQDADSSVVRLYNLARRTFLGSVITLTATSL
ncbi:hypothetical protein SLS64_000826 [Diaporthe eres]